MITGPMFQVGCASACSGVTSASSSRLRCRNGPPLAVSTSRRTSSARPPRRHWAIAECSESTGTIWPGAARPATSCPPMISDSLLASASTRPASMAASVAASPTAPVTAFSTTSQGQAATSATASGPARTFGSCRAGPPAARAVSAWRAWRTSSIRDSLATATTSAPNSTAWLASRAALPPPAARPATRNRPGLRRMMSAAWVPIDPVEPSSTMSRLGECVGSTPALSPTARPRPRPRRPPHPGHRRGGRRVTCQRDPSRSRPAMTATVPTPALRSWRGLPAAQQPDWPDLTRLQAVTGELAGLPPLVFAGECDLLRAAAGRRDPRRGVRAAGRRLRGDVRGRHGRRGPGQAADAAADGGRADLRRERADRQDRPDGGPVRQAAVASRPRCGAAANLPAYRGDAVNGFEFTRQARTPDPARLLRAYHCSAVTLNLCRAFATGGYADLHQVHAWNQDFVSREPGRPAVRAARG